MSEDDSVYSDDEIRIIAQEEADRLNELRDHDPVLLNYIATAKEWSQGPVAWFTATSGNHNDGLGISPDELTSRQMKLIRDIIGKAMKGSAKGLDSVDWSKVTPMKTPDDRCLTMEDIARGNEKAKAQNRALIKEFNRAHGLDTDI